MKLRKLSEEVFVTDEPIVRLGKNDLDLLKYQARTSPRKRARICAHNTSEDPLHEMIIAISSDSYIHPHKHSGKSESFHIVEGEVDVVIFNEEGKIEDVIFMADRDSGQNFFYRLSQPLFHTLLVRTEYLVVHETTNGPFDPSHSIMASFAPLEEMKEQVKDYLEHLSGEVSRFKNKQVM